MRVPPRIPTSCRLALTTPVIYWQKEGRGRTLDFQPERSQGVGGGTDGRAVALADREGSGAGKGTRTPDVQPGKLLQRSSNV